MCRSRIGKKPTDDLGVPGEDPPVGAKNETIGGGVSETPPGRHVPRPGRRRKKIGNRNVSAENTAERVGAIGGGGRRRWRETRPGVGRTRGVATTRIK